jgi:hypothetical protein
MLIDQKLNDPAGPVNDPTACHFRCSGREIGVAPTLYPIVLHPLDLRTLLSKIILVFFANLKNIIY